MLAGHTHTAPGRWMCELGVWQFSGHRESDTDQNASSERPCAKRATGKKKTMSSDSGHCDLLRQPSRGDELERREREEGVAGKRYGAPQGAAYGAYRAFGIRPLPKTHGCPPPNCPVQGPSSQMMPVVTAGASAPFKLARPHVGVGACAHRHGVYRDMREMRRFEQEELYLEIPLTTSAQGKPMQRHACGPGPCVCRSCLRSTLSEHTGT